MISTPHHSLENPNSQNKCETNVDQNRLNFRSSVTSCFIPNKRNKCLLLWTVFVVFPSFVYPKPFPRSLPLPIKPSVFGNSPAQLLFAPFSGAVEESEVSGISFAPEPNRIAGLVNPPPKEWPSPDAFSYVRKWAPSKGCLI